MYKILREIKKEFNVLMGDLSVEEIVTNFDLIDALKRFDQIVTRETV
jgi:hypothetical protein